MQSLETPAVFPAHPPTNFIDIIDAVILRKKIAGWTQFKELPYTYVFGDVNLDGEVKLNDAIILKRYVAGVEGIKLNQEAKYNADVNLDGKIDDADADILRKHAAGWTEYAKLPVITE